MQSQQSRVVTVSRAVQEAVEKNLNLLAERYNVSVADAQLVTARLRPNPALIFALLFSAFGSPLTKLMWRLNREERPTNKMTVQA